MDLDKIYAQKLDRFSFIREVQLDEDVLVVEFEDILVKSTNGLEKLIRGVFIHLHSDNNITLARYRVTPVELIGNYFHSHCSSAFNSYEHRPLADRPFCYGSYHEAITKAKYRVVLKDDAIPLLIVMHHFLSNENHHSPLNSLSNLLKKQYKYHNPFLTTHVCKSHLKLLAQQEAFMKTGVGIQGEITVAFDFNSIPDFIKEHPRYRLYQNGTHYYHNVIPTEILINLQQQLTVDYGKQQRTVEIYLPERIEAMGIQRDFYPEIFQKILPHIFDHARDYLPDNFTHSEESQ